MNLSNFKLPHGIQVALGLAVLILTWVMAEQAKGDITLPAAVVAALTIAKTFLGLFSNSASGSGGTAGQRGFAGVRLLGALAIVGIVAMLVFGGHTRTRSSAVVLAEGQGCAFWKQEQPTVVQDLSADGMCVLQAAIGGMTDPALIAAQCLPLTASQVGKVLTDLVTYYLAPHSDAGAGAAPPPYKGIPESLTPDQLQKLIAARDAAGAGASK